MDDECSQPLCPGLFVVVVVHIGTRECTLHNSPHWRMLDGFGYMCVGSILRYYPWIRQEKVTYTCMMAGHERPTWSSALQCRKLVLRDVDLPMSSLPSPSPSPLFFLFFGWDGSCVFLFGLVSVRCGEGGVSLSVCVCLCVVVGVCSHTHVRIWEWVQYRAKSTRKRRLSLKAREHCGGVRKKRRLD